MWGRVRASAGLAGLAAELVEVVARGFDLPASLALQRSIVEHRAQPVRDVGEISLDDTRRRRGIARVLEVADRLGYVIGDRAQGASQPRPRAVEVVARAAGEGASTAFGVGELLADVGVRVLDEVARGLRDVLDELARLTRKGLLVVCGRNGASRLLDRPLGDGPPFGDRLIVVVAAAPRGEQGERDAGSRGVGA